jgi:hypothetical protein
MLPKLYYRSGVEEMGDIIGEIGAAHTDETTYDMHLVRDWTGGNRP